MDEVLEYEICHRSPDGQLCAAVDSLSLIIRKSGDYTRFLILQRSHGKKGQDAMLASGTEPNVDAAMIAARRAVTRIASVLDERKKQRILAGDPTL
jgi:hypothetical protein